MLSCYSAIQREAETILSSLPGGPRLDGKCHPFSTSWFWLPAWYTKTRSGRRLVDSRVTSKWRAHLTTSLYHNRLVQHLLYCSRAAAIARAQPTGTQHFWIEQQEAGISFSHPDHLHRIETIRTSQPTGTVTALYSDTSAFPCTWFPFTAIRYSFTWSPSNDAFVVVDLSFLRC